MNTLRFGKFKGVPIDDVEIGYIQWLLGQPSTYPETTKMLQESLARRGTVDKTRVETTRSAPAQHQAARPTSGSYDGGGIACPACGAMLDVTLAESQVPF